MTASGLRKPLARSPIAGAAFVLGLALIAGAWGATPAAAAKVDDDAKAILRSMSDYLGGVSAFSTNADIDSEIVDFQGQKLHLSSSAALVIQRPGKLYIHRRGGLADVELIFDGKVMTIHGVSGNRYMQLESAGDIDQAVRATEMETELDFPGADLLFSSPYESLMNGVESGDYLGSGYVNGIECHHLAFRTPLVDWQIWVQTGDAPLPMKYVITTKWVTAAPQYAVRFSDWNTKPAIAANRFEFTPKKGAKKLDQLPVSATGELALEGK